jgi:hypothetical protein
LRKKTLNALLRVYDRLEEIVFDLRRNARNAGVSVPDIDTGTETPASSLINTGKL